jgi:hypothetical protein
LLEHTIEQPPEPDQLSQKEPDFRPDSIVPTIKILPDRPILLKKPIILLQKRYHTCIQLSSSPLQSLVHTFPHLQIESLARLAQGLEAREIKVVENFEVLFERVQPGKLGE